MIRKGQSKHLDHTKLFLKRKEGTSNMSSRMWPTSSASATKATERAPQRSPASTLISRSLNVHNLPPGSPTSFFYYSSSHSDICSYSKTESQSSFDLSNSPYYSTLTLKDVQDDALNGRKQNKLSFSNNVARTCLLSRTQSLSFQPHTPTLSVVTFSCNPGDIPKQKEQATQSKKANVQRNTSREANVFSRAISERIESENLTTGSHVELVSPRRTCEAETKASCVSPVASIRSLPSQSPTISLVAFNVYSKNGSITQLSADGENEKYLQDISAEETMSSLDEVTSSAGSKKIPQGVPTETYDVDSVDNTEPSKNSKELKFSKSVDQNNFDRDDNMKKAESSAGSEQEKSECDNGTRPTLSPVQPPAPPPSASLRDSEDADRISNAEKFNRFWFNLQSAYKNAGSPFRISSPEEQEGSRPLLGMWSSDLLPQSSRIQYSLSRKGLEVVQDSSQQETTRGPEESAQYQCVSGVVIDNSSPYTLSRVMESTWTNSAHLSQQSDSEVFSPCQSDKSFMTASSSSDKERESLDSRESNSYSCCTAKAKRKGSVNFSTTISSDGADSIIRCVVRDRNNETDESKTNENPSVCFEWKSNPPKAKKPVTKSNKPVPKSKTSQVVKTEKAPQTSVDNKLCIEPGSKQNSLNEPVEQSKSSSAVTNKGNDSKENQGGNQGKGSPRGRVRNESNTRKQTRCKAPVKVLDKSVTQTQAKEPSTCIQTTEPNPNGNDKGSPNKCNEPKTNLNVCVQNDKENVTENKQNSIPTNEPAKERADSSVCPVPNKKERRLTLTRGAAKMRKTNVTNNRVKSVDRGSSPITVEYLCNLNLGPEYTRFQNREVTEMRDMATTIDFKMGINKAQQTVPVTNLQYPSFTTIFFDAVKSTPDKIETRCNSSKPNPCTAKFPQRRGPLRNNALFSDSKLKKIQSTNKVQPRPVSRCVSRKSSGRQKTFKSAMDCVKKTQKLQRNCSKSSIGLNECSKAKSTSKISLKKQASFSSRRSTKGENKKNNASFLGLHYNENANTSDKKYSRTTTNHNTSENQMANGHDVSTSSKIVEPNRYGSENISRKFITEKPSYTANICIVRNDPSNYGWPGARSHESIGTTFGPSQQRPISQIPHSSLSRLLSRSSSIDSGVSCGYYTPQDKIPSTRFGAATRRCDANTSLNEMPFGQTSHSRGQHIPHSSADFSNRQNSYSRDSSIGGYINCSRVSSNDSVTIPDTQSAFSTMSDIL